MNRNDEQASKDDVKLYQQIVGSLIYASGVTRPDISRGVNYLAEFMTNPSPIHQEAVDHCLHYLYQTKDLSIEYSGTSLPLLNCSADAAFANTEERRSVQGFVFKLCGGPMHWNSSKQETVTTRNSNLYHLLRQQKSRH